MFIEKLQEIENFVKPTVERLSESEICDKMEFILRKLSTVYLFYRTYKRNINYFIFNSVQ